MPKRFAIDTGLSGTVSGLHYPAEQHSADQTLLILAHGAGASQDSEFMRCFALGMAARGIDTVTFDFLYVAQGRRAPDSKSKLEATYLAVIKETQQTLPSMTSRLVIGGKSMGGRIASQLAADPSREMKLTGLVFLGYPLHPPGRPERRRDEHLASITTPMLFVQGGRDPFGNKDEMRPVVDACQHGSLHVVEDGDHSLKLPNKMNLTPGAVYDSVQDVIGRWIETL